MGSIYSLAYYKGITPDHIPEEGSPPTFDSQLGFEKPRKPREIKLTEQEAKALRISPELYDYCVDLLVEYNLCRRRYEPFFIFCSNKYEAYKHCEMEDYILRMKEFEREKRLRLREMKKKEINVL